MNRTLCWLMVLGAMVVAGGCQDDSPELYATVEISGQAPGDTPLAELAASDHRALLQRCIDEYDAAPIMDYTCTMTRRETINGWPQPVQRVAVKFRQEPFSVAMAWETNPTGGDRCVYVAGLFPNRDGVSQMVVRPAGAVAQFFAGESLLRVPDDPQVMERTRKPITTFGFRNNLTSLLAVYEEGHERGLVEESFQGEAMVNGRPCLAITRVVTEPWDGMIAYRTVIFIDEELLVPTRLEGYDETDALLWWYQFDDVAFNVGLDDEDFTLEANDITPPRR
jgi:hypothetical protein